MAVVGDRIPARLGKKGILLALSQFPRISSSFVLKLLLSFMSFLHNVFIIQFWKEKLVYVAIKVYRLFRV